MTAEYVGIDVGGTGIKWSVLCNGEVVRSGHAPTPRTGEVAVVDTIAALAREATSAAAGIGVAVPATVNPLRREIVFLPNIPGQWQNYPIAAELERRLAVPVTVINDARAFAFGELASGAGRGSSNVLFLTLGTGVGGAIALDGRILIGPLDAVGEIGHYLVEPGGELCGCGGRGCLETIASGTAIASRVTRAVMAGLSPRLTELIKTAPDGITPRLVAVAATSGDPWSIAAFERAGHAIGIAAASTCLLLQLQTVVIGGGLSPAFPLLSPAIERVLQERVSLTGRVKVRRATLGHLAGSIGAALYAMPTTVHPDSSPNGFPKGTPDDLDR